MKPGYESQNLQQAVAHVGEEAGEVATAVCKSLRFGLFGGNPEIPPKDRVQNMEWILNEIQDARRAFDALEHRLNTEYVSWYNAYRNGTLRS